MSPQEPMISSRARLRAALTRTLDLPEGYDMTLASYRTTPGWDSVAHMQLISALEDEFSVMLETADVLALSGWDQAVQILSRHGIEFD